MIERNVKIKQKGKTYSLNEGYAKYFHPSINEYLKHKKYPEVRASIRGNDSDSHRFSDDKMADFTDYQQAVT